MATLILQLSEYEQQAVQERAAAHGKTIEAFMLEAVGVRNRGTIYQAEKDIENGDVETFETFDEFKAAFLSW